MGRDKVISLGKLSLAFKVHPVPLKLLRRTRRKIFEEAKGTGRLSYTFSNPVQKVIDRPGRSQVVTAKGAFSASRVISTLPINVAERVQVTDSDDEVYFVRR